MEKLKNFIYDKNDIIVTLIILIIAAGIIYYRIGVIMNYPNTLVHDTSAKTTTTGQQAKG